VKAESPRVEGVSFLQVNDSQAQAELFYGLFYGRAKFCCKTVQCTAMLCEYCNAEIPSVRNDMQTSETLRNSLGLNYKSAALDQLSYAG
jgi:hypothetical protein